MFTQILKILRTNIYYLIIGLCSISLTANSKDTAKNLTSIISENLDDIFVELRNASLANNFAKAVKLGAFLQKQNYSEVAYVKYYLLRVQIYNEKGNIRLEIPDKKIADFLSKYQGLAIADRLRNDWLLSLGLRKFWRQFNKQYAQFIVKDDIAVKSYALMSQLADYKNTNTVLTKIRQDCLDLMQEPKYFTDAGLQLAKSLYLGKLFTATDMISLARLALEQNQQNFAKALAQTIGVPVSNIDYLPGLTLTARKNPELAYQIFSSKKYENQLHHLTQDELSAAWGMIGQFLAKNISPLAISAFKEQDKLSSDKVLSNSSIAWKARTFLIYKDFVTLKKIIEAMPLILIDRDPAWTYWYARSLSELGDNDKAVTQYLKLTKQFNFYALLARQILGEKTHIPPKVEVSRDEIARIASRFALSRKFYAMSMPFEGMREWNWILRSLSTDRELIIAAKYAENIELLDRVISTAERTTKEHNFSLRYITPYQDLINKITTNLNADPAWIYGLIKQESRFMAKARSHVGASGLMQVMPKTAHFISKKIGFMDYKHSEIDLAETNIFLGVNYFKMLLRQFNGSIVLAAAAYNAGPQRVNKWKKSLSSTVDAADLIENAIFIENIPFEETRTYVKNVLTNISIYSAILNQKTISLQEFLRPIETY